MRVVYGSLLLVIIVSLVKSVSSSRIRGSLSPSDDKHTIDGIGTFSHFLNKFYIPPSLSTIHNTDYSIMFHIYIFIIIYEYNSSILALVFWL